ncbi:MAG: protein kinase [Myxococcota bacterium]
MAGDNPLVEPWEPTRSAPDLLHPRPKKRLTADPGQPPPRLGDYVLERRLGVGGMGEVFVARRGNHDLRVALKTLQRVSSTNLLRFKNEFRALADVRHPNLVELYALGTADGHSFFTMELLGDATPFVDWVRRGAEPGDLPARGRLEGALAQLVRGVAEIHHHGYVHRDLKPSNVLVTSAGRVVILDFGLLSAVDGKQRALTNDGQILGTPSYMAPEQAVGLPAGPTADLYAVGVMLYECLTGRLPIEGAASEVLAEKLLRLDVDAALAPLPPRWRELCGSMLRRRPERRTSVAEVLASLEHVKDRGGRRHATSLVGREAELEQLRAVRAALDGGSGPRVVHLRGPSGQGKSALLRRHMADLRDEGCLVISGRCREQESIPYKGIDALVDALALHLRRLPEAERAELRPRSVAALACMFPVLDELWPDAKPEHLEPGELRGVAWAALREVIGGLAPRGPLALAIDDAQWSDLDSVRLLEALLDGPQPPNLLLLLVLRDDLGDPEALRAIAASAVVGPSVAHVIELGPLSPDDARTLVMLLATQTRLPSEPGRASLWADSIALRARGSPLFIAQLVLGSHDSSESIEQLEQLVERRLVQLDSVAHRLLAVIAVAGGPLPEALALALAPPADATTLQRLHEQGLIVGSSLDGRDDARVETAHDRVREVMLASLEPGARADLHTALGEYLLALARGGEGDRLFRAVDQLDAGLVDADCTTLGDERRLRLPELNRRAGARARDTAAWVPASRYFDVAARLIEPWITRARTGGEHHRLCVDVIFGQAETSHYNDDERWLERTDTLLRWSLSDTDYGRILSLQVEGLIGRGRHEDARQRSTAGLERPGVRIPRSPSVVRAFVAIIRGWWAIRRLDRAALLAMPTVSSERAGAAMHVMLNLAGAAFTTEPNLGLWIMSRAAAMTVRYGYHDRTLLALAGFGILIVAKFDVARATRLYDACMAVAEQRVVGGRDLVLVQVDAQFLLFPRARPLRQAAATLKQLRRRSVELGDRWLAEFTAWLTLATLMDAGHHPLPEIVKIRERWRQESKIREPSDFAQATDSMVGYCEVLIHGAAERDLPKYEDMSAGLVQYYGAVREMMAMTYCGDYCRVLSIYAAVGRKIRRMLSQTYLITHFALAVSIATAECLPSTPPHERRRLRRYRRILRGWAADVPENYAPILDIVEAEYACLLGRFDRATTHYERAVEAADKSGMVWLAGLAAERLARQAERRGHVLLQQGALEGARGFYETWGATALVRRIDAQRASMTSGRAATMHDRADRGGVPGARRSLP